MRELKQEPRKDPRFLSAGYTTEKCSSKKEQSFKNLFTLRRSSFDLSALEIGVDYYGL